MKKLIYISMMLVAGAFTFSACTEDYTDKIDKEFAGEKLVVEAYITNDNTQHSVKLSKLVPYFSGQEIPTVSGATVTVERLKTGEVDVFTEVPEMPGLYVSVVKSFAMGSNEDYKLTITNTGVIGEDGKDFYESIAKIKPAVYLDSVLTNKNLRYYKENGELDQDQVEFEGADKYWEEGQPLYAIRFDAVEPIETTGDYYQWLFYKNGVLETDTLNETAFETDMFVNGQTFDQAELWSFGAINNDTITVEFRTITKELYDFMQAVMLETDWNGGPFSGPSANPPSNISNGAIGIFGTYSLQRISTIVVVP